MPWLSILIPVYNVAEYLEECVQSLLIQCDENTEIIIVDDQSTDHSFAIAQGIASNSNLPIKVLQLEKNSGISAVRNYLIEAASGHYLWFVDSDDVMAPGAISELRQIVDQHAPDLIMCDYHLWRPETSGHARRREQQTHVATFAGPQNRLLSDPIQLFSGFYKKGKLHCWSKIFKRSLWSSDLQFPVGQYFEDMVIAPRLALNVTSYYYTTRMWIHYRQRPGSILAVPSRKKIDDMTAGIEGVLETWIKKYPNMPLSVRFVFISYCVKVFFYALKELKKINAFDRQTINHYRNCLLNNAQSSRAQLLLILLMKGDLSKCLKLLRYI